MHPRILAGVLAGALIAALPAAVSAQTELRLINSFDSRQSASRHIVAPYVDRVKQASNGRIAIAVN
ncbi:MAG TPA: hypothetical protein VIM38_05475, partial [Alphaproteobacteria bacterium]